MKQLKMLDDTMINYAGKSYADFLTERADTGISDPRKNLI